MVRRPKKWFLSSCGRIGNHRWRHSCRRLIGRCGQCRVGVGVKTRSLRRRGKSGRRRTARGCCGECRCRRQRRSRRGNRWRGGSSRRKFNLGGAYLARRNLAGENQQQADLRIAQCSSTVKHSLPRFPQKKTHRIKRQRRTSRERGKYQGQENASSLKCGISSAF